MVSSSRTLWTYTHKDVRQVGFYRKLEITQTMHSRVADCTRSLIDHVLCNSKEKISQSGVIPIIISDHFLTFCTRNHSRCVFNRHNNVSIRSTKYYCKDTFVRKLTEANWENCFFAIYINECWKAFRNIFIDALDSVVPVKEIRLKHITEPWMTTEIIHNINQRDRMNYVYIYKKW